MTKNRQKKGGWTQERLSLILRSNLSNRWGEAQAVSEQTLIQSENYPYLFCCADAAAASAQKMYLVVQRVYIVSLVLGSALNLLVPFCSGAALSWVYTLTAIVFAAGLLVLWVGRARRDDQVWFDNRAVAESVKTASWRFMMKAPPFENDQNADHRFIAELQEIRSARPRCATAPPSTSAAMVSPAISTAMRQVRAGALDVRKSMYLAQRLQSARLWYVRKSGIASTAATRWFWSVVALQMIAMALAILQATQGSLPISLLPVIATCTAAAVAWNQLKRHDEIKQSYALATQELAELESIAAAYLDDNNFPQFVEQVEEAISREHTMWCARRDVPLQQAGSEQGRSTGSLR